MQFNAWPLDTLPDMVKSIMMCIKHGLKLCRVTNLDINFEDHKIYNKISQIVKPL